MSDISRADFKYWTKLQVRWGDVDRLGHVNNVLYFRYAEDARTGYVESLMQDTPDMWKKSGPILAEIQCQFIRQLHHPATLEIGTRVLKLGNSSMQFMHAFYQQGSDELVATSTGRIVWFDYENQRSVRIPDELRERIRDSSSIPPQEN